MRRLLALALLLAASEARADRPPPAVRHVEVAEVPRTEGDGVDPSAPPPPFLGLRFAPLQLIAGIGQVGAELRLHDRVSLLAHAAYGRVKTADVATGTKPRKSLLDFDVQGRFYPVGDMTGGIYGSAGVEYTAIDSDQLLSSPLLNLSPGMHLMPSFGASYLSPWHVGVDLQFIFAYRVYEPTPTEVTPAGAGLRPSSLRIGAALALVYLF